MGQDDRFAARNVVLTGFMGTGKTSVGRRLAERLGYEFVDTDHVIEERHGPIPEIFREHGEGFFRRLEREVAEELGDRSGLVIATGGRMMVDPVNAELLGRTADVFCLTADVDTIVARVTHGGTADADDRPLLARSDVRERIGALLAERAGAYARFEQVVTEGLTPDELATALAAEVEARRTT